MDNNELLALLPTLTLENWSVIDNFRNPPVPEVDRKQLVLQKLSIFGITEYPTVTKEFVLQLLTTMDAKQFVGEDLDTWVDNQIELCGSLEEAFDELVIKFL